MPTVSLIINNIISKNDKHREGDVRWRGRHQRETGRGARQQAKATCGRTTIYDVAADRRMLFAVVVDDDDDSKDAVQPRSLLECSY